MRFFGLSQCIVVTSLIMRYSHPWSFCMFSDMLPHDTVLARSFCLISWLKRAGVAGSSASLSLFAADCVCIPDSPSFIQHYISHLSTYSSITSPLPARLAVVAGPAYLFTLTFSPSARLVIVAGLAFSYPLSSSDQVSSLHRSL